MATILERMIDDKLFIFTEREDDLVKVEIAWQELSSGAYSCAERAYRFDLKDPGSSKEGFEDLTRRLLEFKDVVNVAFGIGDVFRNLGAVHTTLFGEDDLPLGGFFGPSQSLETMVCALEPRANRYAKSVSIDDLCQSTQVNRGLVESVHTKAPRAATLFAVYNSWSGNILLSHAVEEGDDDWINELISESSCLPILEKGRGFGAAVLKQMDGDVAGRIAEKASRSLLAGASPSAGMSAAVELCRALAIGAYGRLPALAREADWNHVDQISGCGEVLAVVGILAGKEVLEALLANIPEDGGARAAAALNRSACLGLAHPVSLLLAAIPESARGAAANGALLRAAESGEDAALRALLLNSADVNCRGARGFTPLMLAAASGHRVCAMTLVVQGGADHGLVSEHCLWSEEGETAAEIARRSGHTVLADQIEAAAHAVAEQEMLKSLVPEIMKRNGPNRF